MMFCINRPHHFLDRSTRRKAKVLKEMEPENDDSEDG